ncbi:MAG: sensor histidine kinase [Acidobacteria bacterium]|nr:sensor histidine kinase [Acidobacteriota bacterium]
MTLPAAGSALGSDAIVGYRAFLAVVVAAYFTLIALTPRAAWMPDVLWAQLLPLSALYLSLGIWGFDYARRRSSLPISLSYLLVEFAIGMRINSLAWGGGLPLILLPLAAQAVILLPRRLAAVMCVLVIAGVSGNLSWVPEWPHWLRNIAQATAAVVFVVVYVGVAQREREARQRTEALSVEVAQLAAANERNRMAREIHDTVGHYLTVIHVQLEAARAVIGTDAERGMLAITRAQALAKDGLAAVRQSVKALREDQQVERVAEQIASLVDSVRDERFAATFKTSGKPCPVRAAVALALHRTTLEALTNVRKHADAANVEIELAFLDNGRVQLRVHDDGKGATDATMGTGFGLRGIRERAQQLSGTARYHTAPGLGFTLNVELPA